MPTGPIITRIWLTLALLWLSPLALWAAPSASGKSAHTEAALLAEPLAVVAGQPFTVALRLRSEPHWHTYWLNPGDSGLATSIEWTLPAGFSAGPIQWPTPQRLLAGGLISYAYEGEVALLVEITPPATLTTSSVTLQAAASWLECKEACVPGDATLTLVLPVAPGPATPDPALTATFAAARAAIPVRAVPANAPVAGQLTLPVAVTLKAAPNTWTLRLTPPAGTAWRSLRWLPLTPGAFLLDPELLGEATGNDWLIELPRDSAGQAPDRLHGVLLMDPPLAQPAGPPVAAWEISLPLVAAAQPGAVIPAATGAGGALPPASAVMGFWLALLAAFAGGLLLNLMPCVLPVLSLKISGFTEQAQGDGRAAWHHGLAYTAGIVASFWLLAGLLLALRASGEAVGWGFQMQSPLFVGFLAALFTLMGLSFLGVFEMGLSLTGLGSVQKQGLAGSFGTGIVATAAATPCTGPFMSGALAAAAALPPAQAMIIFTALALGLAAPYLLLSRFPALQRWVPRPGRWMESLKQGLGLLLLATTVYMAWVFGTLTNVHGLGLLLAGLLLVGVAAWLYGRWGTPVASGRARASAIILSLALLLGAGLATWRASAMGATSGPVLSHASGGIPWEPFSPTRLAELRAAGTPVFVDFTASWCLTCQVNAGTTFSQDSVRQRLADKGVVAIKADWTRRDPQITELLRQLNRNGVPVYALYAPGAEAPKLLPEILTPGIVLDALDQL